MVLRKLYKIIAGERVFLDTYVCFKILDMLLLHFKGFLPTSGPSIFFRNIATSNICKGKWENTYLCM